MFDCSVKQSNVTYCRVQYAWKVSQVRKGMIGLFCADNKVVRFLNDVK